MVFERRIADKNVLDKFAEDFCRVVDKHSKYIVVSGFVAIASGRVRATEDIDMVIEKMPQDKFLKLHEDLDKNGFECMQSSLAEDIYDYLVQGDNVRYTRKENRLFPPEMDVHFPKDKLDELQLEDRQKIDFIGLDIWFSSIESNIAFKEELLKSDKDMEDAGYLRRAYSGKFSEEKVLKIKQMIKLWRMKNER